MTLHDSISKVETPAVPDGLLVRSLPWALAGFGAAQAGLRVFRYLNLSDGFDTGLLENVLWRIAHGLSTQTAMTGGYYVSTHASGIVAMFLPLFRWWPTYAMPFMLVVQTASVILVAWAGYLAATALGLSQRIRLLIPLAVALSPGAFLATQLEIHETTLGIGALAMAITLSIRRAPAWAIGFWAVLAAACRIEMAVAVLLAGLVVWSYRSYRNAVLVTVGVLSVAVYLWWLFSNPYQTESIAAHFSYLGSSPREVILSVLASPWKLFEPLGAEQMWLSVLFWLLPFGLFVPLMSPRWLVITLPSAGVAIFGVWEPADYFIHHYWYIFLVVGVFATTGAIASHAWLAARFPLFVSAGLILGWALLAPALGFFVPPKGAGEALRLLPVLRTEGAQYVSAPVNLVPRIADRPLVAPFPRPFDCSYYRGPYRAPDVPPDVIVVPRGGVTRLGGQVEVHLRELLQSYDLVAHTTSLSVWKVRDRVGADSAYVPCSPETFSPTE